MGKPRKSSAKAGQRQKWSNLSCVFCDKVFANPKNLKGHIRLHIRELPYDCKLCDATFSSKSALNYHKNRVHLKIKYTCPKCQRDFNSNSNLSVHQRRCAGEKVAVQNGKETKSFGRMTEKKVELGQVDKRKVEETKDRILITPKADAKVISRKDPVATSMISEPSFLFQPISTNLNFLAEPEQKMRWDPSFFLHMNRYDDPDPVESSSSSSNPPQSKNGNASNLTAPKLSGYGFPPENHGVFSPLAAALKRMNVGSKTLKTRQKTTTDSPHRCGTCAKHYSTVWNLRKHEKLHADATKEKFACLFCLKGFLEKSVAVQHIAEVHQNPEDDPANIEWGKLRCGICGETFPIDGITLLYSHIGSEHYQLLINPIPEAMTAMEKLN